MLFHSYESMKQLCDKYNKAITNIRKLVISCYCICHLNFVINEHSLHVLTGVTSRVTALAFNENEGTCNVLIYFQ